MVPVKEGRSAGTSFRRGVKSSANVVAWGAAKRRLTRAARPVWGRARRDSAASSAVHMTL
jgi:hypothetical protein